MRWFFGQTAPKGLFPSNKPGMCQEDLLMKASNTSSSHQTGQPGADRGGERPQSPLHKQFEHPAADHGTERPQNSQNLKLKGPKGPRLHQIITQVSKPLTGKMRFSRLPQMKRSVSKQTLDTNYKEESQ